MTSNQKDDISALCSHARIDERVYRLFPATEKISSRVVSRVTVAAPAIESEQLLAGVSADFPAVSYSRAISILDNSDHVALRQSEARAAAVPFCLHSPAGGTGRTTVLATLARIYSAAGRSVLLVDDSLHSQLPFYFGGRPFHTGKGSFSALQEAGNGPVRILTRDTAGGDWFGDGIAEHGRSADHVLIDGSPTLALHPLLTASNPVSLVVLACDMNSALSIRRMREMFEARGSTARRPLFVLNRFDASVTLHVEIRDWMKRILGELLLPVTIRRSDEPAAAMADGLTVVDHAPNSPVAHDYLALAELLDQSLRLSARNQSTASPSGR